jgi:putative endonuclease
MPLSVMAGLVPAIHAMQHRAHAGRLDLIYIVTNRANATLYTGVTSNLSRRIFEHREGRNNTD